jgi:hypothetical protein
MQLAGTPQQQLIHLITYWGRMYEFKAPDRIGSPWIAVAKFGDRDELKADSSVELLLSVRGHYKANKLPGS